MVNVGLIGSGYWGPNYARVFQEIPGANLVTVADLDEAKLKGLAARYPYLKTTREAGDILSDPDVDAVIVSTPATTHYDLTKRALEAGKHVLVEKPLTTTTEEGRRLVALARKAGRVLMVGHIFEYNSGIAHMKSRLDTGDLGDLQYLYMVRTGLGPIRQDVNVMWDLVPHDVSILLHLLDAKPERVTAEGAGIIAPDREDVVFVTLRFPGGVLAHIHASWLDPHKIRRTTLIGSKKMLVFDDVNVLEPLRIYEKGADKQYSTSDPYEFQVALRDGDILIPKVKMQEPLKAQVEHFVACVRDGESCRTDGEKGLAVVEVCEAIEEALRGKR